jgi:hypothetical protein
VVQDGKEAIQDGEGKIQRRRSDVVQRCYETFIRRRQLCLESATSSCPTPRWVAEESFRQVEASKDPDSDVHVEDAVPVVVREVDDVT